MNPHHRMWIDTDQSDTIIAGNGVGQDGQRRGNSQEGAA